MIAFLLAAALSAPTAPPDVPPLLRSTAATATSATVLARYAEALVVYRTPSVISFEYTVDQTGARELQQTHRVFRRGLSQRDELLTVEGKKLNPPSVRIFEGRRNRYTVEALAPRLNAYTFKYLGPVRSGNHTDAVFATTPIAARPAVVRQVQIDGITFLPVAIRFTTGVRKGSGSVTFGRVQKYWLPLKATAKATYAKLAAEERISFYRYRFPTTLPASTFAKPRPLPSFHPAPY